MTRWMVEASAPELFSASRRKFGEVLVSAMAPMPTPLNASLLLAARFRRFWPLAAGILVATLANHAVAAWSGQWLAAQFSPDVLRWGLAISLLAVAIWVLIPDRLDGKESGSGATGTAWHAFWATTVAFFLAEIGDKTQIATVLLAARYESLIAIVAGTTLGMLLANVPVIWLGERFAGRLPLRATRIRETMLPAMKKKSRMRKAG